MIVPVWLIVAAIAVIILLTAATIALVLALKAELDPGPLE